jgi:hypothetical protein
MIGGAEQILMGHLRRRVAARIEVRRARPMAA